MKHLITMVLATAVLSGCTGTHIKPPPVCDGKHRRPANLYGSVLPSLPVPLPPSQSEGQSLVAPPSGGPGGAVAPVPVPSPSPDDGPGEHPKHGAMITPPPAPRGFAQDIARSYAPC